MTERSDLANLRALGEPHIHDWAGAAEPIGAGLVEWTRRAISHDQPLAVRAALDACALVSPEFRGGGSVPGSRAYVDAMLAAIARWLADPSRDQREVVRSSLDVTRQAHAWQIDDDPQFWILEAVDHTCLTVWAGERASYIVPVDFATTAGRVIACVFHAMRSAGKTEQQAADAVIDVVLKTTA
jgi:hypothetical protein